ncbi:MAG: ATP-dependent Clp protease proteolytic subunit [Armatimonadetes bacterium]|nr:ATP-dependent Clp protease proteolytic subunit [Armatimonadota bacterium]
MPNWTGILEELKLDGSPEAFDNIRRKYLIESYQYTGRPIILYASKWTQPDPNISPDVISINDEDIQGLMAVIQGLPGDKLDLILHSPGGSAETAEAIVTYLRSKFSHIRVIVPQQAMSAATMLACAADVIVMGKHSFLGPIDPQFVLHTPLGLRIAPAQAILDQFDKAQRECQDPANLASWLPMLSQYGPDLLVQCENHIRLSKKLVESWLANYMFRSDPDGIQKAHDIANWLSAHKEFDSHGRHIPRIDLEARQMKIEPLEHDQTLQDLLLSVFHATMHTFTGTGAVKIIENSSGRSFIKVMQQVVFQQPPAAT